MHIFQNLSLDNSKVLICTLKFKVYRLEQLGDARSFRALIRNVFKMFNKDVPVNKIRLVRKGVVKENE